MTTLTGRSPAATYKDLLQVSNSNAGIDGTLRPLEDGEGTQSALLVSTAAARLTGPLDFAGTTHAGVTLNSLTTGQRDALTPAAGMAIHNTTTGRFEEYNGTAWASGGAVATVFGRSGAVTAQPGDYSIGQVTGAATVASTGAYSDLTGKPTLGTAAPKAASDNTKATLAAVTGTIVSGHNAVFADAGGTLQDGGVLATVAATGAYADLSGKPTLAAVATSGAYTDLTARPTLATVATTGAYTDLTAKPDFTPYARLDTAQVYTKQQNTAPAALTDGATVSWNLDTGQAATVTLGGNRTLATPTNMVAGGSYVLTVKQDATGSRSLAYGPAYKWPGDIAPVLSITANAVDMLTFYCDGTYMRGGALLGYSA